MKKNIKKELLNIARRETGCEVQHNEMPCNTCFHSVFCDELGDNMGHLFWLLVLGLRGDYTEKDLAGAVKELAEEMEKEDIKEFCLHCGNKKEEYEAGYCDKCFKDGKHLD